MHPNLTRVHEAGHWLMAQHFGLPVTAVQVSPDGDSGYIDVDITGATASQLALLAAAGAGAEIAVFGEIRSHTHLVSDFIYTLVDPRIDFETREV